MAVRSLVPCRALALSVASVLRLRDASRELTLRQAARLCGIYSRQYLRSKLKAEASYLLFTAFGRSPGAGRLREQWFSHVVEI